MPFTDITIKAPSGQDVIITDAEEAAYTKKAFEQGVINRVNRQDRIRRQLVESSISAVGQAVGFALGGVFAGILLTRILGVKRR